MVFVIYLQLDRRYFTLLFVQCGVLSSEILEILGFLCYNLAYTNNSKTLRIKYIHTIFFCVVKKKHHFVLALYQVLLHILGFDYGMFIIFCDTMCAIEDPFMKMYTAKIKMRDRPLKFTEKKD